MSVSRQKQHVNISLRSENWQIFNKWDRRLRNFWKHLWPSSTVNELINWTSKVGKSLSNSYAVGTRRWLRCSKKRLIDCKIKLLCININLRRYTNTFVRRLCLNCTRQLIFLTCDALRRKCVVKRIISKRERSWSWLRTSRCKKWIKQWKMSSRRFKLSSSTLLPSSAARSKSSRKSLKLSLRHFQRNVRSSWRRSSSATLI